MFSLLLLAGPIFPCATSAAPIDQFLYQGTVAEYRGDYDAAIPNWNAVLQLNPDNLAAWRNRGLAYLHKEDWSNSITDYGEVIRRKPNDIGAFDGRGYAHFQKKDWDAAINDFQSAIRLNSKNAALYRNLGRVYLTRGDWDNALTNFTRAIQLNPLDAWAYNCRAVAHEDKGDLAAAIADFRTALRVAPGYANVYLNCGYLFQYEKNDLTVAIADYTEAIRLEPTNADLLTTRAEAYAGQNAFDKALNDYNTAIQVQPAQAGLYFARAIFEWQMTNYAAAPADYAKALQLNPANSAYWAGRGEFNAATTNYHDAIADFTRCLQLAPATARFYADRARAETAAARLLGSTAGQKKLQALGHAENDWQNAAELDSQYLFELGSFRCLCDRYADAIADFTEYIKEWPANSFGWNLRALAYEKTAAALARQGNFPEENAALVQAAADWDQVVARKPAASFLRGDFFARHNIFDRALADYEHSLALSPTNYSALVSLAWFRATCPVKNYRNGFEAMALLRQARDIFPESSGLFLAAQAAAHAEAYDFPEAVRLQKGALAAADLPPAFGRDMERRLALYEKQQPCHRLPPLLAFDH